MKGRRQIIRTSYAPQGYVINDFFHIDRQSVRFVRNECMLELRRIQHKQSPERETFLLSLVRKGYKKYRGRGESPTYIMRQSRPTR